MARLTLALNLSIKKIVTKRLMIIDRTNLSLKNRLAPPPFEKGGLGGIYVPKLQQIPLNLPLKGGLKGIGFQIDKIKCLILS